MALRPPVQQATQRAVASKPAAVRLAQALEGGLVASGQAEGPASVERFIRMLQELGAVNVVRPGAGLSTRRAARSAAD